MVRRSFALAGLVLYLALPGLSPGPAWAAPNVEGARLSFLPAPAAIQGCETISVQVWANEVVGLYGVDIALAFDAGVLEVVDADPARPGVQVQHGGFLSPDFVVNREADNTAGAVHYTVSQVAPSPPVDGSGVLLTVLFRARSATTASALAFTQTDLVDLDGALLEVTPVTGSIGAAPPAAPALAISRLNETDVWLSWTTVPGLPGYRVYRGDWPYFAPTEPAYQETGALGYGDPGVLGSPAANYYYVVAAACANGFCSEPSNRVAKFEFSLAPGGY